MSCRLVVYRLPFIGFKTSRLEMPEHDRRALARLCAESVGVPHEVLGSDSMNMMLISIVLIKSDYNNRNVNSKK